MITRSYKALTSRPIFVLAAALAILMLAAPFVFAATSVDYAEDRTDAVATFSATDQDGDPIVWSLGGDDAARFMIDGGVLSFKSQPNYEDPNSKSTGTLADRNVYNVTVEATGGSEAVTVNVTNVDEDGSVSFIGEGRYQPQVGRSLEATLSDPDRGPTNTFPTDEKWQWARSMDMETWTDIDGATAAKRSPVTADEGHYLRVSVTYTDEFDSGKMVYGMTASKVEERTLANAAPSFEDQDDVDNVTGEDTTLGIQVNRSVDENTAVGVNIGRPVSASDADNDLLVYTLEDTPDLKDGDNKARFTIAKDSGQIKVGKKLGADTGQPEDEDSATAFPETATAPDIAYPWLNDTTDGATAFTAAASNVYILEVKATDPSGADTTQAVAVTVNDINEAPAFEEGDDTPKVLNVVEGAPDGATSNPLRVGADGTTALDDAAYNADDQDADQAIGGDSTPADNETNAALSVDGADKKYFTIENTGELDFVDDDTGTTDVDESHTPDFEEKSSYSITIVASSGEGNRLLRTRLDVMVHVIDAEDQGKVDLTAREPQVGRTVVATVSDPDGGVTLSRWAWATQDATGDPATCPAADAGTWDPVDPDVSSGAYTPKAADVGKCLRATATYTDNIAGNNDPDDVATINTEMESKVSEKPVQASDAANTAPKFQDQDLTTLGDQSDEAMRSVPENMDDENVGGPINAVDADGDAMLFTLSGDDAASFKTDNNGQIKTKVKLDFETKDMYMVALTATDPSGAADTIMVTVTVTDGPDKAVITGSTSVDYAEDRTDAVATFSATDQDGDPIVWSLGGDDAARFMIDGGVLSFKSQPNYEDPNSKSTGTLADRNVYNVTVEATGGSEAVTVNVTNVDEDGSVSFIGEGRYQPQVGRSLEATLSDPDRGPTNTFPTDEKWQWARSMDMETWTDIDGATAAKRSPVTADEGHYLRVSVTYTDEFDSGKMVYGMTASKVEERTLANAAPSFEDQDDVDNVTGEDTTLGIQVNRSVDENTAVGVNIGRPVSASDADNDLLVYTLEDTPDLKDGDNKARFTIAKDSGQIKVGKKLGADTGQPEDEDSATAFPETATAPDIAYPWLNDTTDGATAFTAAASNVYILEVKATDPSGADTTQAVAVTVNDINEAPAFEEGDDTPKVLNVVEGAPDGATSNPLRVGADGTTALDDAAYNADDQDADQAIGGDSTPADNETNAALSVDGADKKYFTIENTGELDFVDDDTATTDTDESHTPNYEDKSSYSITVVATSGTGDRTLRTRLDVMVHVIDAEDQGKVDLTAREPQVGRTVVATVSDPDGGVTLSRWAWTTQAATGDPLTCPAADAGTWANVTPDVSSGAYTPKSGDVGMCLRATATYTDNIEGDGNDDADDGNMEMVSKVSEKPVQASDPANTAPKFQDQDLTTLGDQSDEAMRSVPENMDDVNVGGPINADDANGDAMLFTLSGDDAASFKVDNNGQIKTKVKLDYETKDMYVVALTATDPSGASDSIMVTIMVTDGPDEATLELTMEPEFDEGATASRSVDENTAAGMPIGEAITATDKSTGDSVTYSLDEMGDMYFDIDSASGQLMTEADLDYETRDSYSVTVTATDTVGLYDMITVTITVTDVNDAPTFDAHTVEPVMLGVAENTAAGENIGDPVMAMDEDEGDTLTYAVGGDDMASFAIDSATGQLMTMAALDYETKSSYSVTVMATDSDGLYDMIAVTITVTDVNDQMPMFADDMAEFSVAENAAAGTEVGMVMATDDADDSLMYSGDSMYFDVDPETGQIVVAEGAMLDYEMEDMHMVTVTASDGEGSDSITVTITVTDMYPDCGMQGGDAANMYLNNDCEALLDAKDALGGSLNWSEDMAIADWDGVQGHPMFPSRAGDPMRVTALHLQNMELDGEIPAAIGRLDALMYLNVHSNGLSGDLSALGGLENLVRIYANNNVLDGLGDLSGRDQPGNSLGAPEHGYGRSVDGRLPARQPHVDIALRHRLGRRDTRPVGADGPRAAVPRQGRPER